MKKTGNNNQAMGRKFVLAWLKKHKYCVIATSFEGEPWAATVDYIVDDNLNIYIATNPNSLKFKNLIKNPVVCLVIDGQSREGTLQMQGTASPLKTKGWGEANVLIKPKFLIFKKKEEDSNKVTTVELSLN